MGLSSDQHAHHCNMGLDPSHHTAVPRDGVKSLEVWILLDLAAKQLVNYRESGETVGVMLSGLG